MYHVACGMTEIYAGERKRNGEEWSRKSVVTKEAINAVAQHQKGLMDERREITHIQKFKFNDGSVLKVTYKLENKDA